MTYARKTEPVIGAFQVLYQGGNRALNANSERNADEMVDALNSAFESGRDDYLNSLRKMLGLPPT